MKKGLIFATLPTALALALYGCGGDTTSDANTTSGIGGTGYISSGTITGFGSVFVNGVEFETNASNFDIEGISGTQGDLAIGMVVKVNGSINSDGITGTATSIVYDDDIQGPVSGITSPSPDKKTFTVFGTTVIADINTTSYDGTNFDFAALANGNNVEVSGFYDANNQLVATRIELKNVTFDSTSEIELKGTITGLTDTNFTLNGVNIDASAAELSDLPNGLVNGAYVEAKGTYDTGSNTITASKVEGKDNSVEDTEEFELEGFVSNYTDLANFQVNQIPVDASNATLSPPNLTLKDNEQIEVEGSIVNGKLIATELKLRGGEIKIKAKVSATDAANNTFTVTPVTNQPAITVKVGTETEMENDLNETDSFSVTGLNLDDFVEIEGYDNGDGSVFASGVKVKAASDIVVKGVVEAGTATGTTITVLGVEFQINTPAETSFKDTNDSSMTQAEFFSAITLNQSVVKIEDKVTANGTADTIEIESP